MEITDEVIKRAAGHPDCIPSAYIEWFFKGAKWMQNQSVLPVRRNIKNEIVQILMESENNHLVMELADEITERIQRLIESYK